MKSTSSCDVEISVTVNGMETVEPVPECLQDVFLCHSLQGTCKTRENRVSLPKRYAQLLSGTTADEKAEERETITDKMSERERDIGTALDWIKQELVSNRY